VRGISIREFARREACSDTTVHKALKAGTITPYADGSLDPALVGTAWRGANSPANHGANTGPKVRTGTLSAAKLRKARAHVRKLQDQVTELFDAVLTREEAAGTAIAVSRHAADRLNRIPDDAAGVVVGRHAGLIAELVRELVHTALDDLASTTATAQGREEQKPLLEFSDMDAIQLAAAKETLLAEKLEIERALKRGELVDQGAFEGEFIRRASATRTTLLGMPSKLAPHLASAPDAAAARGLLQAEVNHAIAHLACEHISAAELIGDAALSCGERPDGSQPETAAARDRGAARAGKSREGDSRRLAARRASEQLAPTLGLAAALSGARQRKESECLTNGISAPTSSKRSS